MCFCADVPRVTTRTRLVILQHPREHRHPFGTARLVDLALPHSRLEVPRARNSGALDAALDLPEDAAVLFPHPSARDLASLSPSERPRTLVVLDGTWAQAKSLYRHNPWLHACRHVRLHPSEPSRYRIRREPKPDYVSTVEAIVGALRILEPETEGLDNLLRAFERMIDRQVTHLDVVERHGRDKRQRQRESRRLPVELGAPDLVVAYAETSMPGGDPDAERALVQWAAVKVDSGEVFDAILQPRAAPPTPDHLAHMRLEASDLATGLTAERARAAFAAFAGAQPTVAAWTKNAFVWGAEVVGRGFVPVHLKTACANLRGQRPGLLDDLVRREGLPAAAVACRGRAATRLGNALALARWLRAALP